MKKKCEECNKEFEASYNTDRLNEKSKYCLNCINKMLKETEQKQAEELNDYYYGKFNKFGYNYISNYAELMKTKHTNTASTSVHNKEIAEKYTNMSDKELEKISLKKKVRDIKDFDLKWKKAKALRGD